MLAILFAAALATTAPHHPSAPEPLTSPDAVADTFFAGLQSGDVDGTYRQLSACSWRKSPARGRT